MSDRGRPTELTTELVGTKSYIRAGLAIAMLFFGGLMGWLAAAPLHSAAIAPGVATVAGSRKSVQHFEGGIISEIHASNGQYVEADDTLLVLEDVAARSQFEVFIAQRIAATVEAAQVRAERDGESALDFGPWMDAHRKDERARRAMIQRLALFEASESAFADQLMVLDHRIETREREIEGLTDQIRSQTREIRLLRSQIKSLTPLHERGHVQTTRIIELQKEEARLQGELSEKRADVELARVAILELQAERDSAMSTRRLEAATR
ncbi:MAG: hypothetical protein MI723_10375, partial [Caulobacterales bacterium]|nr:hypothetical protein [Caulobacterales bacterium]